MITVCSCRLSAHCSLVNDLRYPLFQLTCDSTRKQLAFPSLGSSQLETSTLPMLEGLGPTMLMGHTAFHLILFSTCHWPWFPFPHQPQNIPLLSFCWEFHLPEYLCHICLDCHSCAQPPGAIGGLVEVYITLGSLIVLLRPLAKNLAECRGNREDKNVWFY